MVFARLLRKVESLIFQNNIKNGLRIFSVRFSIVFPEQFPPMI